MKKVKAIISLVLVIMMVVVLSGFSSAGYKTKASDTNPVKITLLNSKNDISQQLSSAVKAFEKANPNISINILSTKQSPVEMAMTLYASGTPATLCMLDAGDIPKFKDKAADLSGEKWVKELPQKDLIDGKTLTFPFAVEGYGLIYNKAVVEKALGKFNPATINTRAALENFFNKLKKAKVNPLVIGSMDWSLGNHYLALTYANQPGGNVSQFINGLKAGKVDLTKNSVYKGVMDTFDIMKKYNLAIKDPMAVTYEASIADVATGKTATTFNGNWSMMDIQKSNPKGQFGFIPVPISNKASDKGNSCISIGATKQIFIDNTKSTKEQQDAAKKFLNWIVYDKVGQDFLVNKCNIVAGFKNITLQPATSLGREIKKYNNAGKAIPFAGNYVPADHWQVLGASMQKYLVNKIDKAELAKEVKDYWTNIK